MHVDHSGMEKQVVMSWSEHEELLKEIEDGKAYVQDLLVKGKTPVKTIYHYGFSTRYNVHAPFGVNPTVTTSNARDCPPVLKTLTEIAELQEGDESYHIQQVALAIEYADKLTAEFDKAKDDYKVCNKVWLEKNNDITSRYTKLYDRMLRKQKTKVEMFLIGFTTAALPAALAIYLYM